HYGDVITCGSSVGQRLNLKIVGIFDAGIPPIDNGRVYVTIRNAQILLGRPDIVGRIDIKLEDTERAPAVTDAVERMFGYDAESWQETNSNFLAIFAQQNTIISFVVGAIL